MKRIHFVAVFILMVTGFLVMPLSVSAYQGREDYEENGFHYRVLDKKAVVTGADVEGEHLEIPSSLGGFPVTQIDQLAFSKSKYTTVSLPDSITSIGYRAFGNSKQLKSIKLPRKLKKIESATFVGCTKLSEVQFNTKLTMIERFAFSNCVSLKRAILPESVHTIGSRAFEKCYKLNAVSLGKKLNRIGENAFYRDYALKSIRIPSQVIKIEDEAFRQCEALVKVSFDSGRTKIGDGVFQQCTKLKKAVLPKDIRNIPESTFAGCTKLTKVVLPKKVALIKRNAFRDCKSLKTIKLNTKLYAIGDYAFAQSGLKRISLNQNMQFIGNGAFMRTKIRKFTLTSKITFIGNRVFADCKKLKTISIPSSVKGINPGAFNNCINLQSIRVSSGNKYYCSEAGILYDKGKKKLIQYPLHKKSKSFSTPGGLKEIRARAFSGNPFLENVTISAYVIGDHAFFDMKKLKSVTIVNGAGKVDNYAFGMCRSLRTVALPDSVTYIGRQAFAGTSIGRLHIPSKLTRIGENAFYNCNKLTAFDGGRGAKYAVSDGVLYNNSMTVLIKYPSKKSNKIFVVPNSVRKVKWRAFDNVSKLVKLEFGTNLRTLEYYSIHNVKKLKSIIFHTKRFSYVSSWAVSGCSKLAVIVGPNNSEMRRLAENAHATLITL